MFVYSSYWHTWSRVLGHVKYGIVELNLTPINASWCGDKKWQQEVGRGVIRRHCTHIEPDNFYKELPSEVLLQMGKYLDAGQIAKLLTYDFLPEIDWALYDKHRNAGCAFELCRKVRTTENNMTTAERQAIKTKVDEITTGIEEVVEQITQFEHQEVMGAFEEFEPEYLQSVMERFEAVEKKIADWSGGWIGNS